MNTKILYTFLLCFSALFFFTSCSNDDAEANLTRIKLYLTDDPLDVEEVNVEILSIILKGDDPKHEIVLNTIAGVYNLLDFQGDADTLLASGNFDLENIKEIRMILGEDNTIVKDGVSFPLEVSQSAKQIGIKIKINQNLVGASVLDILIDFDACSSVKEKNGTYSLSPVIRYKGNRNVKTIDKRVIVELDSCYTINFPVNVQTIEDKKAEVGAIDELIGLYNSEVIYGVLYPISVTTKDGEIVTINKGNEADKLIKTCNGEEVIEEKIDVSALLDSISLCYQVEYPVLVVTEDGTTVEIFSAEDLTTLSSPAVGVEFPINVLDSNGNNKKLNNLNQIEALLKNCERKKEEEKIDLIALLDSLEVCYMIEYPITIVMKDGMTIDISAVSDIATLPSPAASIVFPFNIIDTDGETKKINNYSQIEDRNKSCGEEETLGFNEALVAIEACFDLTYPVSVIGSDSIEYTVDNIDELKETANSKDIATFIFPLEIRDADGKLKTINNASQLSGLLKNCKVKTVVLIDAILACFTIDFPLSFKDASGEKIKIENLEELSAALETHTTLSIDYPISLINKDGETIKVQNRNKLEDLLEDCE